MLIAPSIRKAIEKLALATSVAILCAAFWFLHRELASISFVEVTAQLRSIPTVAVAMATGAAACSYLVLTAFDGLALRYVGHTLPYRTYGLVAFLAFAIGNNVGIAMLSGGSVRYRMYSLDGLSATEIARVIVFVSATFGLGASALLGSTLLWAPTAETAFAKISPTLLHGMAILLLLVPTGYVAISAVARSPVSIRNWRLAPPRFHVALAQVLVSVGDLAFSALTLYVLLEPSIHVGFLAFLGIYLLAIVAGLLSSVPGGLGVFEATLVAMLPQASAGTVLGTVIVYRLIYYVSPLCIAIFILVWNELRQQHALLGRATAQVGNLISSLVPQIAGIIVFLAGVVLLVSGAMPAVEGRLRLIAEAMPLPILEMSHMAGSMIGVFLLVLARGVYQRLHAAYLATLVALTLGIAFSLLKGLDYEEAAILSTIAAVIWVCRSQFHRVGSTFVAPFSPAWLGAIALVLSGVVWVMLLSYRDVSYKQELWWQFALDADAPRALRAGLVAVITLMAVAVARLLQSSPVQETAPGIDLDMDKVRQAVLVAQDPAANLALLGDKRFVWSEDERAFIMYQISGRSWIAFGDPVGPECCHEELVWTFRELVDRHDARPVFYQVSDRALPLYIDLGLSMSKLGEVGRVDLRGFSLEGRHRAALRQACNRAKREGAVFEVIPRNDVPALLNDLRRISDAWLAEKATAEKGFSLGAFSEAYIRNFDCAVVRVDREIVAFANLWYAPAAGELSIDLMRYSGQASKGIMDYLFAELMIWGSVKGYSWFDLGMAPLSGMEQRALAPLWHKLGHLIFTHGESFYNFEGLRSYKEKFRPEWHPKYLACPGGLLDLPAALIDASRLISGGLAHAIIK